MNIICALTVLLSLGGLYIGDGLVQYVSHSHICHICAISVTQSGVARIFVILACAAAWDITEAVRCLKLDKKKSAKQI